MRTLFVKLFLWFWLVSTLSGLISFMLGINTHLTSRTNNRREGIHAHHTQPLMQSLQLYGRTAAAFLEREGNLAGIDAGNQPPSGGSAYLFTIDGIPLSKQVPDFLGEPVRQFAIANAPAVTRHDPGVIVAVRVAGPSGKQYIAAGGFPLPPPNKRHLALLLPPDIWYRIAVSIVIGGLACYALAWRMASPIRQLRTAAQQLAEGDLSARVRLNIAGGSSDEMVDLGRDFNRMAERIEHLVSAQKQLVRDVSHELRSPLARLSVALGLARREDCPSSQAALERIERETDRLNALIGELLTLSLLDGNGDRLGTTLFSLDELTAEVVHDADFEAASKDRQVRLVASEPTMLSGNRELLRRALENIVRNGARYTDEGTVVEVSLEHTPSGQAILKVRDHGPGVPEAALSDIFRPFYRVAPDRDRHSGGAGIGLAIAERTVHLSGGSIQARNVADGGLEVEIRLPLQT